MTANEGNINEIQDDKVELYKRGYPTLRSSTHLVKDARKLGSKKDPGPVIKGSPLPDDMRKEVVFDYDESIVNMRQALVDLLSSGEASVIGGWCDDVNDVQRLEDFRVPIASLTPAPKAKNKKNTHSGNGIQAQKSLSDLVVGDETFMEAFDAFVYKVALPHMKIRLQECQHSSDNANIDYDDMVFYYQRPPTIRIQPGPSNRYVRTHRDSDYGHQDGELNFWVPFTDINETKTTLWTESHSDADDYHSVDANLGQIIAFHGTSCRHFVPPNPTPATRISMDFRIGVKGYFDPSWMMKGTANDHSRREIRF